MNILAHAIGQSADISTSQRIEKLTQFVCLGIVIGTVNSIVILFAIGATYFLR